VLHEPFKTKPLRKASLRFDLKRSVVKLIRLKERRRNKLRSKLVKAGYGISPEEFIAGGILRVLPFCFLSLTLLVTGNLVVALYMVLLIVLFYRLYTNKLEKKLSVVDKEILEDLSEFMNYVANCLKTDKDITGIIEDYLSAAGHALKHELKRLLADLKTGNIDEALLTFEMRLGIPHLSNFITVIRAALDGEAQSSALDFISLDMEFYEYELAKKKSAAIPGKISKASFIVVGAVLCFLVIVLFYALIIGLTSIR
jgi:Flp pilus assembly protein TadB